MKSMIVLMILPALSWGCGPGTTPFRDTCVVDIQPEQAAPVKPSDEKISDRPPFHIVYEVELTTTDEHYDKQKADADRDGKQAAGIKP